MATLALAPGSGSVGEVVTVSGGGFPGGRPCRLVFAGVDVGGFKTTGAGAVPRGTRFSVPEVPTVGPSGELGTKVAVEAIAGHEKDRDGDGEEEEGKARAEFELRASVSSDADEAYLGDEVTVRGKGLLANEGYRISLVSPGYVPYAAGLLDTGPHGSGDSQLIIPDYVGAGLFQVDLLNRKEAYRALHETAPLKILGFSYESLAAGRPKRSTGGPKCPVRLSVPFKNASSIPFLPVVYAIVYDEKGQPLQITSSGAGLQPRSTADVVFCFPNLPRGKYRVGIFATTGTGRVLSRLFTFPLRV